MHVRASGRLLAILCTLAARGAAVELPPPDWDAVGAQAAYTLAEYVRIDTQNPPGRTVEAADFLEQRLRRAGLHTERLMANREKPFVIGRLRGTEPGLKPIVLLNHMDVVPADPAQWSFPPLSGEIRDGVLYGRGAIDMKGFGIVQLAALQLLATRKEHPKHDIVFLAVPDEETGGTEGIEWLAAHRDDVMNATAVWDEGGLGVVGLFPRPTFFIAITEKKVLWLRLVAHGRAGHGSRPFPDSAPLRLQQALERISKQPPAPRLTAVVATTFARLGESMTGVQGFTLRHLDNRLLWPLARGQLVSNPLTDATVRDTIALTMLNAGYKPNVIPERAEAVLDCRLLPDTDQDAFIAQVRRTIADDSIGIEIILASDPAMISPTDNLLFEAIERSIASVYPDSVITPYMSLGGTDSRVFRRHGVPAYGVVPMPLTQDLVDTMHGIDERIPVSVLGPAVRIVYEALRQL